MKPMYINAHASNYEIIASIYLILKVNIIEILFWQKIKLKTKQKKSALLVNAGRSLMNIQ